jgi:hypothetical protein
MFFVLLREQTSIISLYSSLVSDIVSHINTLETRGHYMYHQSNIQHFYGLPTWWIYEFCVDTRTNSYYFPIQHLVNGFVTHV